MNTMMKKFFAVFVPILALTGGVQADTLIPFPDEDGQGDLASESSWGAAVPPKANNEWTKLAMANATWHASKSVDLQGFRYTADGITIDQTPYPDAVITLKYGLAIGYPVDGLGATLIGGYYDLCGSGQFGPTYSWNAGNRESLTIDSGAVITNINYIRIGYHTTGNRMVVKGGSKLYVKEFQPFLGASDSDCSCEFSGGSQMIVQGSTFQVGGDGSARDNLFFTGEGTAYSNTVSSAAVWGGAGTHDILVRLDDKAGMYLKGGAYVWNGGNAYSNRIEIANGASLISSSHLYFCKGGVSCFDNVLNVEGGGSLEVRNANLIVYGSNSLVSVSNSTMKITGTSSSDGKFTLGADDTMSFGCKVRISGPLAEFSASTFNWMFNNGTRHVFEIGDHATVRAPTAIYLYYKSTTNALRVVSGGKFAAPNILVRAYPSGLTQQDGNTVFIGNGASVESDDSYAVYCSDNRTIVSNGTLNAVSGVMLGNRISADSTERTGGNELVLQGRSPKVRCGTMLYVNNNSRIVLDLPEGGYLPGETLISASNVSVDGTESFVVNNAEACLESLEAKSDVAVLSVSTAMGTKLDDAISAANETLPKGVRLYKTVDNKQIRLCCKPQRGMLLIFR